MTAIRTLTAEKKQIRLLRAIEMGNAACVDKVLKQGAVPCANGGCEIPLLEALRGGRPDLSITGMLLDAGADPNERRDSSSTVLTMAVEMANLELARQLLEHRADPNIDNGEPLLVAARNRDVAMVELLLAHGADPSLRGIFYFSTPLIAVCSVLHENPGDLQHNPAWSKHYFDIALHDTNHRKKKKGLEELYATFAGDAVMNIIQALLRSGADIDDCRTGTTAFHTAIQGDNLMAELCLINAGARDDVLDDKQRTPRDLYSAAETERGKIDFLRMADVLRNPT